MASNSHTLSKVFCWFLQFYYSICNITIKKNIVRGKSAQQPLQNIVAYNFFNSVSKLNITHQLSNTSLSTPKNQQILRSTASQTLEGSRRNTW